MAKIIFEDGTIIDGAILVEEEQEIDEVEQLLLDSEYLLDEE